MNVSSEGKAVRYTAFTPPAGPRHKAVSGQGATWSLVSVLNKSVFERLEKEGVSRVTTYETLLSKQERLSTHVLS